MTTNSSSIAARTERETECKFRLTKFVPVGFKEVNYEINMCLLCRGKLTEVCSECQKNNCENCPVVKKDHTDYHSHCLVYLDDSMLKPIDGSVTVSNSTTNRESNEDSEDNEENEENEEEPQPDDPEPDDPEPINRPDDEVEEDAEDDDDSD
jgi:hypothetical protein